MAFKLDKYVRRPLTELVCPRDRGRPWESEAHAYNLSKIGHMVENPDIRGKIYTLHKANIDISHQWQRL